MPLETTLVLLIAAFLIGLITGDIMAWRASMRHARLEDQLSLLIEAMSKFLAHQTVKNDE